MTSNILRSIAITGAVLALAIPSAVAERWANVRDSCSGRTLNVSAQLMDIPWGASWEAACAKKSGRGVGFGITRKADRCINNAGMWGEWSLPNHPQCTPKYEWGEIKETCTGNGVQTVSAKLFNIPFGESWEDACNSMNAAGGVRQKGVTGRPDRCVTVAAGVYGEWDKHDVAACVPKLEWGTFKDEGCARDAEGVAGSAAGLKAEGYRVWSSVLWGINGDWMDACRTTPVRETLPNGEFVDVPYPMGCVIAEADEALSWVTGAVLGAGTAFIASPSGPYAIAASGAAIAVGQKGAEEFVFSNTDTGLNVWGFVWVEDLECGIVDRQHFPNLENVTYQRHPARDFSTLNPCHQNATAITGRLTCTCSGGQLSKGSVWGSDVYTADSSICKSALHTGTIGRNGGIVSIRTEAGLGRYSGSTRNGVTTRSYGQWDKSFRFE